jgi:hypothetical protein
MRQKSFVYLISALLVFALPFAMVGCTASPALSVPKINVADVHSLLFWKDDPASGERWNAEFAREGDAWKIEAPALSDTWANSTLLNHLLDSLTTMSWTESSLHGPLENFGLNTPRVMIKLNGTDTWKWGDEPKPGERYFLNRYTVGVSKGAVLGILAEFHSLENLREREVLTFPMDDVDEILWKKAHLERNGDGWKLRAGRSFANPPSFIQTLSQLQIKNFLDGNAQAAAAQTFHFTTWITLQGRSLKPTQLRIDVPHSLAQMGNRGPPVFQLEPRQIQTLLQEMGEISR